MASHRSPDGCRALGDLVQPRRRRPPEEHAVGLVEAADRGQRRQHERAQKPGGTRPSPSRTTRQNLAEVRSFLVRDDPELEGDGAAGLRRSCVIAPAAQVNPHSVGEPRSLRQGPRAGRRRRRRRRADARSRRIGVCQESRGRSSQATADPGCVRVELRRRTACRRPLAVGLASRAERLTYRRMLSSWRRRTSASPHTPYTGPRTIVAASAQLARPNRARRRGRRPGPPTERRAHRPGRARGPAASCPRTPRRRTASMRSPRTPARRRSSPGARRAAGSRSARRRSWPAATRPRSRGTGSDPDPTMRTTPRLHVAADRNDLGAEHLGVGLDLSVAKAVERERRFELRLGLVGEHVLVGRLGGAERPDM